MFDRRFPAIAAASVMLLGSTAGGNLLAASNARRAELRVQPLSDAFLLSPIGSVVPSAGLFVPSGVTVTEQFHVGAVWCQPNAGATAAIAVWESSM